jgi:hypothetical protein
LVYYQSDESADDYQAEGLARAIVDVRIAEEALKRLRGEHQSKETGE